MSHSQVAEALRDAYSDVRLPDSLSDVRRRGGRLRRARQARRWGAVVSAGLIVVGVLAVPPASDSTPPGPIRLVAYDAPAFPLSLEPAPAGLGRPVYDLDPGMPDRQAVFFSSDDGVDRVGVTVQRDKPKGLGRSTDRTAVDGTLAEVFDDGEVVSLRWERDDNGWVVVRGTGSWSDPAKVRSVADNLVDRPTEVPLTLRLAPAGWEVVGYKDNRVVTLDDTESSDPDRTVTLQRMSRPDPHFLASIGAPAATRSFRLNGRPGVLAVAAMGPIWMLQAQAAGGQAFTLQAPLVMTPEQVVELAGSVSVAP